MTSVNSLRTLGCNSSGHIDLCTFRFLRWSQTWSSLTVGGAFPLWSPSCSPSTQEGGGQRFPVTTEAKKLLSTSAFSSSVDRRLPFLLIRGVGGYALFNLPFLADIPVEALLVILSIPCKVQLQLCLGPPDTIPTQPGTIPILFPRYLSLLPLPVQFPLAL